MAINERTLMYFQKTKLLNTTILSMLFYKATKPYLNAVFFNYPNFLEKHSIFQQHGY